MRFDSHGHDNKEDMEAFPIRGLECYHNKFKLQVTSIQQTITSNLPCVLKDTAIPH